MEAVCIKQKDIRCILHSNEAPYQNDTGKHPRAPRVQMNKNKNAQKKNNALVQTHRTIQPKREWDSEQKNRISNSNNKRSKRNVLKI